MIIYRPLKIYNIYAALVCTPRISLHLPFKRIQYIYAIKIEGKKRARLKCRTIYIRLLAKIKISTRRLRTDFSHRCSAHAPPFQQIIHLYQPFPSLERPAHHFPFRNCLYLALRSEQIETTTQGSFRRMTIYSPILSKPTRGVASSRGDTDKISSTLYVCDLAGGKKF